MKKPSFGGEAQKALPKAHKARCKESCAYAWNFFLLVSSFLIVSKVNRDEKNRKEHNTDNQKLNVKENTDRS